MSAIDVVWKQRDGTPIAVCEMADLHVENTLAMLERNLDRYDRENLDGEDPRYIAELDEAKKFSRHWITVFKAEIQRRSYHGARAFGLYVAGKKTLFQESI